MKEILESLVTRMDRQEVMMQQLIDMVGKNNEKIYAMDVRQETMDSRLERMDSRFDAIDLRLERMDSRLERVEDSQQSVDKKLQKIDVKVDRIDSTVDQLRFDTRVLNKRVFKNESDIERLMEQ